MENFHVIIPLGASREAGQAMTGLRNLFFYFFGTKRMSLPGVCANLVFFSRLSQIDFVSLRLQAWFINRVAGEWCLGEALIDLDAEFGCRADSATTLARLDGF